MATPPVEMIVTASEIDGLVRLIADVIGSSGDPAVPFAAPLLLFSRLDIGRRDTLFATRPGRVLVQEHLAIEATSRLPAEAPVGVHARLVEPTTEAAPFRIEADLSEAGARPFASIRATIRSVEATSFTASIGIPAPRADESATTYRTVTRPFDADLVSRWVRLVGDHNPIHTDPAFAAALGLAGPVVPGALLAAVTERCADTTATAVLLRLNMRFMAPIRVGETIVVDSRERSSDPETGRRDLRLFFLVGQRIVAVADLVQGRRDGEPQPSAS
jgi:acyl dehydratase